MFEIDVGYNETERCDELKLTGADLCSKFGFSDGDVCDHNVLIRLVRENLEPLLDERVELEEFVTIHNPIRATPETMKYVDESLSVIVKYPERLD